VTLSVVIPVKDGARYLAEVLGALRGVDVLVIDSGSTDDSVAIARAAGARVIEIPPHEFGHGRTRNLGAEQTEGDLIAFLTQDATPVAGWAETYEAAFADPELGVAYGPHLPRPDTSPMIARELEAFFAVQAEYPDFLSNVNACYRRACWEEIRFDDVPYAEDQAFARRLGKWGKAYVPEAAVLHAHDYPPLDFMRRYFDEYRGLRETVGHVEPLGRASLSDVRRQVSGDRAWLRERGANGAEVARWTARSAVHHGGRKVFSALGSRSDRLPAGVRKAISLERRDDAPEAPPVGTPQPGGHATPFDAVGEFLREGPADLLPPLSAERVEGPLHIAIAIPYFRRGSGGHNSIFQMAWHLEQMGHTLSIWVHDPLGYLGHQTGAELRRDIREWFMPLEAPVFKGFGDFYGADVVVATGWETVYPVMRLAGCRARAYLIHDHEPEFYATSAERRFAEDTYRLGLFSICASPWLAEIVERDFGGRTSQFQFGVDHAVYRPRPVPRDPATVIFYGRGVTGRRAVPLGLLALEELHRRRPEVRFQIFGDHTPAKTPFPYEHLGLVSPRQLAWAYSKATVGFCLSMTNYSLIPQEMLACGLPCVDLAGFSSETVFGEDGPVELADFHPGALADAVERLIDEPAVWERRSAEGRAFVAGHTWEAAARQVQDGLRQALLERS
jgi:glycosyltransferase involved in cell wall biosynthesis